MACGCRRDWSSFNASFSFLFCTTQYEAWVWERGAWVALLRPKAGLLPRFWQDFTSAWQWQNLFLISEIFGRHERGNGDEQGDIWCFLGVCLAALVSVSPTPTSTPQLQVVLPVPIWELLLVTASLLISICPHFGDSFWAPLPVASCWGFPAYGHLLLLIGLPLISTDFDR